MILETLLGGVFGGVLRLAPELLKLLDRKSEREHELKMVELEHNFAKTQAEAQLRQAEYQLTAKEFETLGHAFTEQGKMAAASGWLIAGINALVRPITTYLFLLGYFLVKLAMYSLAIDANTPWPEVVTAIWTKDDTSILFMIISFWFVGRVYERKSQ